MHLITIIIALFAERALGQLKRWRDTDGFARYIGLIESVAIGRRWLQHPAGVLVIVPPVLVVAVLQWAIAEYLWLGFELAFGVFILVLTFGPRDLWEDVYTLAHARSEADHERAEARAVALCRRATGRAATDIHGRTIVGAVLVQGHERRADDGLGHGVDAEQRIFFHRLTSFPVCLTINFRINDLAVAGDHTHAADHGAVRHAVVHMIGQFLQPLG